MHSQQLSSALCRCPTEIIQRIAFSLIGLDPVGPPSALIPLLLSCKLINQTLSIDSCPAFYARIFRLKFDYDAVIRRDPHPIVASDMAWQLLDYFECLQAVRRGSTDHLLNTLWCCLSICVADDGKNGMHSWHQWLVCINKFRPSTGPCRSRRLH